MRHILFSLSFLFIDLKGYSLNQQDRNGYVSVELNGQFGNQLFQIATAYAYALDHNLSLTIPDLIKKTEFNIRYNAKELFLRKLDAYDMPRPIELNWVDTGNNYLAIPSSNFAELHGWFQSERYFKHRRNEILDLFSSPPGMNERILSKYPFLSSSVQTVGIQIRDYRVEQPEGRYHPTIGRGYYEKAMEEFSNEAVFIVSSNNLEYAKECTLGLKPNIIYLQSSSYIEEFYTLVLCKSFIISNSTFGWWAAWLSTNLDKLVIAPSPWFAPPFNDKEMTKDRLPEEWSIIRYEKTRRSR